jgi:hypothetical protein
MRKTSICCYLSTCCYLCICFYLWRLLLQRLVLLLLVVWKQSPRIVPDSHYMKRRQSGRAMVLPLRILKTHLGPLGAKEAAHFTHALLGSGFRMLLHLCSMLAQLMLDLHRAGVGPAHAAKTRQPCRLLQMRDLTVCISRNESFVDRAT